MRLGIGLPAAIPDADARQVCEWAVAAEDAGFALVSVIDRLVYDNLEPIVALAAAAARTERVELLTTVLNVPYRRGAVVLAKQLASIDRLSGGRLTAGLGLGGWPEDHAAAGPSALPMGELVDEMLAAMRRAWAGDLVGAGGPMPALPAGRPRLLFGGFAAASHRRAAELGDGWVAPSFGFEALTTGTAAVREAWARAGRSGRPRVVAERYFCFGPEADAIAEHYLAHYYGAEYVGEVLPDAPTTVRHLAFELDRLQAAGCDDVVLLPCTDDSAQVARLVDALAAAGFGVRSDRVTVGG